MNPLHTLSLLNTYSCYSTADFEIDTLSLSFASADMAGQTRCAVLEPVQDQIVENDEVLSFQFVAVNGRDIFVDGSDDLSLTMFDDDG